ncbi:hypothetical protein KC356_g46 [Hortaea werneckii]|nr:hypothetical protein KC356_g46 [Hortaea werneckii]
MAAGGIFIFVSGDRSREGLVGSVPYIPLDDRLHSAEFVRRDMDLRQESHRTHVPFERPFMTRLTNSFCAHLCPDVNIAFVAKTLKERRDDTSEVTTPSIRNDDHQAKAQRSLAWMSEKSNRTTKPLTPSTPPTSKAKFKKKK